MLGSLFGGEPCEIDMITCKKSARTSKIGGKVGSCTLLRVSFSFLAELESVGCRPENFSQVIGR